MTSYEMVAQVEDGVVEESLVELSDSSLLVQPPSTADHCSLSTYDEGAATYHHTLQTNMAGDVILDGDGSGAVGDGGASSTGEAPSHLTTGDLEALANFQAELDRIGSALPESQQSSEHVQISVTNFDPEETEAANTIDQTSTYAQDGGAIDSSTTTTSFQQEVQVESGQLLGTSVAYQEEVQMDDGTVVGTVLQDGSGGAAVSYQEEVQVENADLIGSETTYQEEVHTEGGVHVGSDSTYQEEVIASASYHDPSATFVTSQQQQQHQQQELCGDVLQNVMIESLIPPTDTGYEETILSDVPAAQTQISAVPAYTTTVYRPLVPAPTPAAAAATTPQASLPQKMAIPARNKPIYLVQRRAVDTPSSSVGEGSSTMNRMLFTTATGGTPSAGATDTATSQLISRALMDAKTLPASMRGKYLAVTSAGGGGTGGPIIAKVMIASSSASGGVTGSQTFTTSGGQTVRLVSSGSHAAATAGATGQTGRTFTLTPQQSLVSPGKTRFVTSLATTPNKQIMVSKMALGGQGQKTPTKITMIPVSMAKSPQKIAPAPLVANQANSQQLLHKGMMVMTTMVGGTPTASILTTTSVPGSTGTSPGRLIFRQTGGQKPLTPRKGTVAALTQQTNVSSATVNHVTMTTAGGTPIRLSLPPTSSTAAGAGTTLQTFQVPGSKFPYIRLVTATTASTTSTAVAGSRSSVVTSATVRPNTLTTASRPIAPVPASNARMAVPIAPANTAPLIGQPMVATKQMTVGGQQRIFIPASSVSQMRPSGGGTSTITVPASALAHLGSSIFTSGGNIVMVPAQYMAQLQAQGLATTTATVSALPTTSTVAAPSSSAAAATASTPVPLSVKSSQQSNQQPLLLPAQAAPAQAPVAAPAPSTSASLGPSDRNFAPALGQPASKQPINGAQTDSNGIRPRKPCNCTKSQCLKLYCDCFANGEFCLDCNCNNCSNNLEREEERQKAIKSCLERNPQAFHPKIGKTFQGMGKHIGRSRDGDIERRHNKGCNCKRSGCLKNYCECYEAKIMCSYMCKCVGCKNFAESADKKTLMHLADAAEVRVQQQTAAKSRLSTHLFEPPSRTPLGLTSGERLPSSFITGAVVEATCQCLLAQAEDGRDRNMVEADVERRIIQEFGRCLLQIIDYAGKTKL